jgi:arabinogalactan oligomer / maltooligosaccharide transport system permease protein
MAVRTKDPTLHESGGRTVGPLLIKIVFLGTVIGVAAALTPTMVGLEQWAFLVIIWLVVAVLVAIYATKRAIPAKYLAPGTLFLVLFLVLPIGLTVQTSFSNYGDGTRSTKEEAVAQTIGSSVVQTPDAPRYALSVGTTGSPRTGPFTFFLVDPDGQPYAGTPEGLEELSEDEVTIESGRITEAEGYEILTGRQLNEATASSEDLQNFTVPTETGAIRQLGISQAFEGRTTLEYDEAADTITDTETGTVYSVQQQGDREFYVSEEGERLSDQSWRANVGFANYERVLTNDTIRGDFLRIFVWTFLFATLSVVTTFVLGLLLAVTFNDPRMRGQKVYRALLIMPYAIPGFISLLLWASFYNRDFGLINELTGLNVNWLGDATAAKAAVVLTNLWMGFPYMFLVCTGALQSISGDLSEAARIDGASGWKGFTRITFPLLLVSVAPLLVATFAFNFNNFNAIQLLTEGGPFSPDNPAAGGTDILISYTIRLAFGAGGAQIGFASAVSVLLFIITGVIAALQFRATRRLEDVN